MEGWIRDLDLPLNVNEKVGTCVIYQALLPNTANTFQPRITSLASVLLLPRSASPAQRSKACSHDWSLVSEAIR